MNPIEELLTPILEVQSALVGTDGPTARHARENATATATAEGGGRHDALAAQGDRQADAAGAGYDAPVIAEIDNWRSWQLEELHALLDGIDVDAIAATGSGWQELGRRIAEDFETFRAELNAATETWTGAAASAAAGYSDGFTRWGTAFGTAVEGTGTRIHQAASAVDLAKINLPEPQEFNWQRLLVVAGEGAIIGGIVGAVAGGVVAGPAGVVGGAALGAAAGATAGGGGDVFKQFVEHQQAQQRGAEVMERFYSNGYVDVDTTTPAFASTVAPTTPGVGATSASGFTSVPGGGGAGLGLPGAQAGIGGGVGGIADGSGGLGRGNVLPGAIPGSRGGAAGARAGAGQYGAGGGGARGRGEEDEEHKTKFVQQEDSGLFAADVAVTKPVIGA